MSDMSQGGSTILYNANIQTSTTYDTFMYLSLPVPSNKQRVVLQELIDEFVKVELLDKEDAWSVDPFAVGLQY